MTPPERPGTGGAEPFAERTLQTNRYIAPSNN